MLSRSIADAGNVSGRVVDCCFVVVAAGRRRGRAVHADGRGPAPLRRRAVGCALAGFLDVLSDVLLLMYMFLIVALLVVVMLLIVACCRGGLRRGGLLAVALLHGSLALALVAYMGVSVCVVASTAERLHVNEHG